MLHGGSGGGKPPCDTHLVVLHVNRIVTKLHSPDGITSKSLRMNGALLTRLGPWQARLRVKLWYRLIGKHFVVPSFFTCSKKVFCRAVSSHGGVLVRIGGLRLGTEAMGGTTI